VVPSTSEKAEHEDNSRPGNGRCCRGDKAEDTSLAALPLPLRTVVAVGGDSTGRVLHADDFSWATATNNVKRVPAQVTKNGQRRTSRLATVSLRV